MCPSRPDAAVILGGMSAAPPLAHLGHWYLWIPYIIPVVIVLAASIHAFRDQRREDREQQATQRERP
jgi:hypothetical protein